MAYYSQNELDLGIKSLPEDIGRKESHPGGEMDEGVEELPGCIHWVSAWRKGIYYGVSKTRRLARGGQMGCVHFQYHPRCLWSQSVSASER